MTALRAQRAGSVERHPTGEPHDRVLVGIRILVVDDDLGVCQSLRDLLTQEGCSVIVATGGREALKRLETTTVDLVLSDVVLPDLDGYELFKLVPERHTGRPDGLRKACQFERA